MKCPVCDSDKDFSYLAQHWRQSCEYPEITSNQMRVIEGCFMGDGSLTTVPSEQANAVIEVNSSNLKYMEHLDELIYPISNGVRERLSASEAIDEAVESDILTVTKDSVYHPKYRLRTRSHPELNRFGEWVSSGRKVFPDDIPFSPLAVKYWYVSDGGVCWNKDSMSSRIQITTSNERDRIDEFIGLFEEIGIHMRNDGDRMMTDSSSTRTFLNWVGEPVPGMEYKWEVDDLDEYERLFQKAYYQDGSTLAYGRDHPAIDA